MIVQQHGLEHVRQAATQLRRLPVVHALVLARVAEALRKQTVDVAAVVAACVRDLLTAPILTELSDQGTWATELPWRPLLEHVASLPRYGRAVVAAANVRWSAHRGGLRAWFGPQYGG